MTASIYAQNRISKHGKLCCSHFALNNVYHLGSGDIMSLLTDRI